MPEGPLGWDRPFVEAAPLTVAYLVDVRDVENLSENLRPTFILRDINQDFQDAGIASEYPEFVGFHRTMKEDINKFFISIQLSRGYVDLDRIKELKRIGKSIDGFEDMFIAVGGFEPPPDTLVIKES